MIFFNKKMYVFPFSFISLWHLIDLIINTVSINIFAPWSWRQRTAAASLLCMCLKHAKNLQFSIPYRGDAHKGVANRNSCPKLAHPSKMLTLLNLLFLCWGKWRRSSAQLLNELSKDINLNFGKSENIFGPPASQPAPLIRSVANCAKSVTTLKNNIHQLLSRSSSNRVWPKKIMLVVVLPSKFTLKLTIFLAYKMFH